MGLFKINKGSKPYTEDEVLKELGIADFESINDEKLKQFASLLTKTDSEVIKSAIQKFPDFAQMSCKLIEYYRDINLKILKGNEESVKSFMDSCDSVLDALKPLLNQDLSFSQKQEVASSMIKILEMKRDKDTENKQWLASIAKGAGVAVCAIAVVAAAVLGVNININKNQ